MSWPTEDECRLLDNHLKFRDSLSTLAYLNSGLFPVPESDIFPKLVVALHNRGIDIEESRRLAGETTMRLPGGDLGRSINFALDILEARAAA
jgi:hypothetical protein